MWEGLGLEGTGELHFVNMVGSLSLEWNGLFGARGDWSVTAFRAVKSLGIFDLRTGDLCKGLA